MNCNGKIDSWKRDINTDMDLNLTTVNLVGTSSHYTRIHVGVYVCSACRTSARLSVHAFNKKTTGSIYGHIPVPVNTLC